MRRVFLLAQVLRLVHASRRGGSSAGQVCILCSRVAKYATPSSSFFSHALTPPLMASAATAGEGVGWVVSILLSRTLLCHAHTSGPVTFAAARRLSPSRGARAASSEAHQQQQPAVCGDQGARRPSRERASPVIPDATNATLSLPGRGERAREEGQRHPVVVPASTPEAAAARSSFSVASSFFLPLAHLPRPSTEACPTLGSVFSERSDRPASSSL